MNFEILESRVGSLDVIEAVPRRPFSGAVVLLHGYGADFRDLVSLAGSVPGGDRWVWAFPNGVRPAEMGPFGSTRSWYPLPEEKLEALSTGQAPLDWSEWSPPGLSDTAQRVIGTIDALCAKHGLQRSQVIIGGFSQGATLSIEVALSADPSLLALAIFSGTLVNRKRWDQLAEKRNGLPFFMTHGRLDPVLPLQQAKRLEQLFEQHGMDGMLSEFNGGHEIPASSLRDFASWLKARQGSMHALA